MTNLNIEEKLKEEINTEYKKHLLLMLTDILKHLKDFYNDEMGYEYGDEY
jgi:GGDEF domain-containing protein